MGGSIQSSSAWEALLDSLQTETDGAIWDFTDPDYPRELIRDTTTPANSVDRDANTGLTYTSPNAKNVTGADELLKYENHNKCLQSQDLSTTWSPSNATITTNTAVAPDGTTTADKITATAAGGDCIVAQNVSGRLASAYVKYVNAPWVAFSNNSHFCWFNVQTGVAGTISPGGGSSTIVDAGNGWWKLTWIQDSSAIGILRLRVGSADFTASVAGGEEALYWGIQVKDYPVHDDGTLSDYVPTTTAAKYRLPIDHDSAGDPLGLLVEEARTNLLTYSEQFDNAAWTTSEGSISANAADAPDGTTTADKLVTTNGAVSFGTRTAQSSISFTSGTTYTFSVYAKAAGYNWVRIDLSSDAFGNPTNATINLSDGTQGTHNNSPTVSVQSVGDGWYRISVTKAANATSSAGNNGLRILEADGDSAYTGNGTDGVLIWGYQIEAGSFPTSYIRTTSATVTRAADDISKATSGFCHSATEGMLLVSHDTGPSISNSYFAGLNAGNTTEFVGLRKASLNLSGIVVDGGSVVYSSATVASTVGTAAKQAIAYKLDDSCHAANGTADTADTSCTMPTVTFLDIGGAFNGTSIANAHIKYVKYLPRRVANADLATETA